MKILGSALILIASVTISYYYERGKKQNITNLRAISAFFEYIKNQIDLFSLPLPRIFDKYMDENNCVISLKKGEEPLIFPNEVRTLINDCFLQLGKSYKDEQIKNLDYTIEQLKEEIEQEEKDFSQKIKVFRAIALFIGCSTVILLV